LSEATTSRECHIAKCAIAVMAKVSAPGRTKTRLAPPLTSDEAARLNTAFLSDIAANLLDATQSASIAGYFATTPLGEDAFFDFLPRQIGRFDASRANFGNCLDHAIETMLGRGHQSACVLNADSPTLPTKILIETAHYLAKDGDRIVLGPSEDGGYYLLGMTRHHRRLFEDIDWSTERVAAQTLDRAAEIGVDVHVLPSWYDVDEASTLVTLWRELFEDRGYTGIELGAGRAAATRALLLDLDRNADLSRRLGLTAMATTLA